MRFFDEVEKFFGCQCLYTALDIKKDATEKDIKRAYHKFSLLCHPDRSTAENKEINKNKFQILSRIHSILNNKEQRAIYDETGELLDESEVLSKDKDWDNYWRLLFKKITIKDLEIFESEYKGSEKEEADLKKYYLKFDGDMEQIMDNVLCSTVDDEERFTKILKKWIDDGEIPSFEAFLAEDKKKKKMRKRQAKREAVEANELAKELNMTTDSNLEDLILARRVDREKTANNFFANLEAKYCQSDKKKPKAASAAKSSKRKRK